MKKNARRTICVAACGAVVLFMAGCGRSNPGSSVAGAGSTTSSVPSASPYFPPVPEPTTEGNTPSPGPMRSPVPTTPAPPVGDVALDSSLIPEATANYHFAQARINGVDHSNALRILGSDQPAK